MNLDPVLLEILVCPDCKGSLTVDQDRDELVCNGCGLAYPVRDNIPIMLVDEARRPKRRAAKPPAEVPAEEGAVGSGTESGAATATADDAG